MIVQESLLKFVRDPDPYSRPDKNVALDWDRIADLLQAEVNTWLALEFTDHREIQIEKGLGRTYKRARKAGDIATRSSASSEQRHRWRKWVKHLYYQLSMLEQCGLKGHKKKIAGLDTLGDSLGQEHDLLLLKGHAETMGTTGTADLFDKIEMERAKLRKRSDLLFTKVFTRKLTKFH